MAKIVALILVAITLVAAQVPAECATAEKKALDGVISSAPPAETKVAGTTAAYEKAADAIITAAPADEFTVMEEAFNAVESVPAECAIADKSICEVDLKVRKALHGVVSAAPPAKKPETKDATFKQSFVAAASLAQAANAGDDKKVAGITAAYGRAADAVIAAAPADKFTVMEETFTAARPIA